MAKTRFELDLTRNTVRRLKSVQHKLLDAASQWNDIDFFFSCELEAQAGSLDKLISEIKNWKV